MSTLNRSHTANCVSSGISASTLSIAEYLEKKQLTSANSPKLWANASPRRTANDPIRNYTLQTDQREIENTSVHRRIIASSKSRPTDTKDIKNAGVNFNQAIDIRSDQTLSTNLKTGIKTDLFQVGVVLDIGGKDDKSFNSSAVEGVERAVKELGITVKYVEPIDENAFEGTLRSLARKKYDLIISIGVSQVNAVKKVAKQFNESHFVIIDGEIADDKIKNVESILFEEHQGSFLIGAIAGLVSQSGKIGFVGGMDIPLIRRFQVGYTAGAHYVKPKIQVHSNFIGIGHDSWNNPAKAKELAITQYNAGIDIIFTPAGASVSGVFDAAEEKKKLAIGVDSNQNYLKPGYILTSMAKRIDRAVFEVIAKGKKQEFNCRVQRLGIKEAGVDYTLDQYNNKILLPSVIKKIEEIKADIVSGKIQVPDHYQLRKEK